jgi:hypothetical protein
MTKPELPRTIKVRSQDVNPDIAREREELAQAQTVPPTMQRWLPRRTFKQVLKRARGAGLVQYSGLSACALRPSF